MKKKMKITKKIQASRNPQASRQKKRNLVHEKAEVFRQLALVAAVGALAFAVSLLVGLLFSMGTARSNMNPASQMGTQMYNRNLAQPNHTWNNASMTATNGSTNTAAMKTTLVGATANKQAPKSGPAESLILAVSVLLGIIGTGTLIALKKGF